MPININNLNPGVWFEYPQADDYTGPTERIKIRNANLYAINEIEKETGAKRVEYVQPKKNNGKPDRRQQLQRVEYEEVDEDKRESLIFDFIIVDWNLLTPEGEKIPCNLETKVKLMRGSSEFNKFVTDCCEKLNDDETKRKEALEKNSLGPASGTQAITDIPEKESQAVTSAG